MIYVLSITNKWLISFTKKTVLTNTIHLKKKLATIAPNGLFNIAKKKILTFLNTPFTV
jgi:hypothetical protein